MATWRRLTATGLLFLAMSLLVSMGHGPSALGDGKAAHAAAVEADQGHPCAVGPSCSSFVVVLEDDAVGIDWPGSPAHLQRLAEPSYLSPHLADDPPPPRRAA